MRPFAILAWVAACGAATPIWPSSTDELEDIMFLNSGYRKSGFADAVTPCGFSAAGPGRITAAEWIRTAFHDMISGDIYFGGSGGLDASIMFETDRPENIGAAFNSSLAFFAKYYSTRASISDLIALSMYTATRSCGGPVVPIRAGRKDATVAGPEGFVPVPESSTGTFENQFARTGFSTSDMITMTACGHTVGGVHAADFPQIVPVGSAPNDYVAVDSTIAVFDNRVAVEWIVGNTTDPMTVGPSVAAGRNSDAKVFGADQNVTMRALTNPTTFATSCASIFQRMIEVVPPGVTFTPFIVPYEVKPSALQLTLLSGGASISFTGLIRVRTTVRPASNIASVQLTYKDRTGGNACGACIIQTTSVGTTTGFDDSFTFYSFSSTITSDTSISSFNVVIDLVGGGTELHDNNGTSFPVQDSIMLQSPQSCLNQGNLTVVAAVRNDRTSLPVSLDLSLMVPRQGVIVPALQSTSLAMVQGATVGPYSLYSTSYTLTSGQASTTKFDVTSGNSTSKIADAFKSTVGLGSTCAILSGGQSSSSSSSTSTSTSSSTRSFTTTSSSSITTSSSTSSSLTKSTSSSATTSSTSSSTTISKSSTTASTSSKTSSTSSSSKSTSTSTTSTSTSKTSTTAKSTSTTSKSPTTLSTSSTASKSSSTSKTTSSTKSSVTSSFTTSTSSKSTTSSLSNSSLSSTSSPTVLISTITSTTSTCVTPTQTSPALKSNIANYTYYGCQTEATGMRALSSSSTSSNTMTLEACATFCDGYIYWGAEYGRECYCGNSINAGSNVAPATDCSMLCAGDNLEYCGAGNRLSVYHLNTTLAPPAATPSIKPTVGPYKYYGCQTEATGMRALSSTSTTNDSMTLELCESFCSGYTYWGTEYGRECYCGNSFSAGSVNASASDCSFLCPGNNLEYCGAGNRLSTYRL